MDNPLVFIIHTFKPRDVTITDEDRRGKTIDRNYVIEIGVITLFLINQCDGC